MDDMEVTPEVVAVPAPKKKNIPTLLAVAVACMCVYALFIPPRNFPVDESVTVSSGDSVKGFAEKLEQKHYIRNSTVFSMLLVTFGNEHSLSVGTYVFDSPLGVWHIASKFRNRDFGVERVKVTFPEGMTVVEMADVLDAKLASFDREAFLSEAKDKEGYLFPDTYYFFPTMSETEIVSILSNTYERKIASYRDAIAESGHTEEEIVVMASIIEKEASGDDDRSVISGILWKRIRIGMPLQVDATFSYLLGKTSSELTLDDLETDSPYNTYNNRGLPPGAIGNPGLLSIEAALYPTESPYLYYLHDERGTIHYAKDFEEHKSNKSLYLK